MENNFDLEKQKIAEANKASAIALKVVATKAIAQSETNNKSKINDLEIVHKNSMETLKNRHHVELQATKSVYI